MLCVPYGDVQFNGRVAGSDWHVGQQYVRGGVGEGFKFILVIGPDRDCVLICTSTLFAPFADSRLIG